MEIVFYILLLTISSISDITKKIDNGVGGIYE